LSEIYSRLLGDAQQNTVNRASAFPLFI